MKSFLNNTGKARMYDSEYSRETQNSSEFSELDANKHGLPRSSKDVNEELLKENTVLRSQFEDAIKITDQLEELHTQNRDLLATVRTLRTEKDDLEHRLEISLQSCKEMQAKLNEEKKSCTTIRGTDLNTMNKEIEKIKAQSKAQLDQIYDQLEKSKQATERESVEKRLLASKLDHILEDSQRYFQHQFNNIDEFMCFLATPPVVQEVNNTQPATTAPAARAIGVEPSNGKLEKKVKNLKNKLKAAAAANSSMEDQIKRITQDSKGEQNRLRSQIKTVQGELQSVREQKQQAENQLNYQIQALQQKNSSLQKKVDQLNDQIRNQSADLKQARKQIVLAGSTILPQTANLNDSDSSAPAAPIKTTIVHTPIVDNYSDDALQHTQDLTDQIQLLTRKRDELLRALQKQEKKYNDLSIEIEKQKADNSALQRVHEADKAEIESLRNALHTMETTEKEIQNKNKNTKEPSSRILKLQKALDTEKQRVFQLQTNESKQKSSIEDLEAQLRLAKQGLQDAENETRKAQNELADVRRQIECTTPPTAEDLLPPCVWHCEDFDPTLSSAIVRIANNAALQPVSKLQNCFKTIRKHYAKQIQARDEALDQAFTENQTLSNAFNQFLVDASIALNDNALTLQDFFGNNAGQKIVDQITSIRANLANLRHQYDTLKGFITVFQNSLGEYTIEPTDTVKQIQEIRAVIEAQKAAIAARSKKIHELKAIVRQTAATLKSKEVDYENQVHDLQDTVKELQCHTTALQTEKRQLKSDNENLTQQLQQATQEREQLESTIVQDDVHNTSMIDDFAKTESQLKDTIKSKESQIRQLRSSVDSYENEVNKQKNLIASLKAARKQRDLEYADLQRVLNDHDQAAAERLETERKNITASFENAVQELKEQCEKHRSDVQKMAVQVSETELKNSQICQEIAQCRKERRKMEIELNGMRGQIERERKLMESQIRAQKVAAENQYNTKLEEQRTKAEVERRRLFALGADAFRSFFNPNETIDERSFRTVLEKARDTITKLSKSDVAIRRMLGAGEQQTTQDAVAQLLMAKGVSA